MPIEPVPGRRTFVKHLAVGLATVPAVAIAEAASDSNVQPPGSATKQKAVFNVVDFGAVPDGRTLATKSIQATIDACGHAGGGKVILPPGRYLSAPLFLRSNLELELFPGAHLLGSTNFNDYPTMQGRWEGIERTIFASLLTGEDLENVTISGRGTIDGQGEPWWTAHRETQALRRKLKIEGREPENPSGSPLKWPRPRLINLYRCKNVHISGVTIRNSPSWTVHPVLCEDVCIDDVTIWGPGDSPNTDGIDPDSCRLVRISNCYISTGDDCIVIKSGYKYEPGVTHGPSEDIVVSNCVFGTGHAGVAIGSETAGGVRNVTVSNCVCDGTRRGLYLKTARGRGNVVENFRASNVVMKNILETAVFVGMFYFSNDREVHPPKNEATPTFRNFHFSDLVVEKAPRGVVIEGLPESPIREFSLTNLVANEVGSGLSCSNTEHAVFDGLVVNPNSGESFYFADSRNIDLSRLRSTKGVSGEVVIRAERVENVSITSCAAPEGSRALVEIRGAGSREIVLALNRVPKGVAESAFADGASASLVEKRA